MLMIKLMHTAAVVTLMGLLSLPAALPQPAQKLPLPVGSTAHFVYFDSGSYALTPQDQEHIRDVAGLLQNNPTFAALIIGKADTVGSAQSNEHLSRLRADAVFDALVYQNKVPESRVRMLWTGEHLPFVAAADEQAESQNRMAAMIVGDPTACQ